jgi:single-strand DNA-binding protein
MAAEVRARGLTVVDSATSTTAATSPDPAAHHRNEVVMAGRLAAAALAKQLPSGDEIVTWRLIIDRATTDGTRKVDVIDCTAFGAKLRRQALSWHPGEVIEVVGALHRRFWRGGGGLQSRCEVAVDSVTRRSSPAERRAAATGAVNRRRKLE